MKSDLIDVIAVVVTYNRKMLLAECLEALEHQTYPVCKIIIVDNCSNDGTTEWLKDLDTSVYEIHSMEKNIGGAGGFCRGMKEAYKYDSDYILILDDDCILAESYVEELIEGKNRIEESSHDYELSALCGTVYENGKIGTNHRGYLVRHRLCSSFDFWREHSKSNYNGDYLKCDIASFCGLMISRKVIDVVGYPKEEYFIKYDDTEYSMRLNKVGAIININAAYINHRIKSENSMRDFGWKYYYEVRNSIDMARSNKLYYCVIKIVIRSLALAIINERNNKYCIRNCIKAIADGFSGRLGRNEIR